MKTIMSIAVSFLFLLFMNTAIIAQDGTGSSNTSGKTSTSQTDSADQTGYGTESKGKTTGTQSQGTTTGTQSTGTVGSQETKTGTGASGTTGSGMGTTGSSSTVGSASADSVTESMSGTTTGTKSGKIHDLSGLDQDAAEELVKQFEPVAEEHASQLMTKLGLDQSDKEDIKSSIMDYFDDVWESRVELDQEKGDIEEERENNEDLADERVELVSEIEDELSDDQANTWKSFKVDWWKSLDTSIFEIQQNATSTMSRSNTNEKMEKNNNDNQE